MVSIVDKDEDSTAWGRARPRLNGPKSPKPFQIQKFLWLNGLQSEVEISHRVG